jgi:hypothetical protein
MTLNEIAELHSGDEVYWTDPDGGRCSKSIVISQVIVHASDWSAEKTEDQEEVTIISKDGSHLECFANELS